MLSKKSINEFQEIYLKTFGEAISFEEAANQAGNLMRLYKSILDCPPPKKETSKGLSNEAQH